jgi:8-oxo-dGTP pyrophosphatase MutT (NUDIX family)
MEMILSAGIIPVRAKEKDFEFLLLRCFRYWDFPKGEIDPGEIPLMSALRELKEETSIEKVDFKWGESFYETEVYSKGKTARYYLAQVIGQPAVTLLPNPESGMIEHHEYRWVSLEQGLLLTNPRIKKVFEWARLQLQSGEL